MLTSDKRIKFCSRSNKGTIEHFESINIFKYPHISSLMEDGNHWLKSAYPLRERHPCIVVFIIGINVEHNIISSSSSALLI